MKLIEYGRIQMANENASLNSFEIDHLEQSDYFSFDELEAKLHSDMDEQLSDIEFLKKDRHKIGNPENLGNTVMSIVWEQFINQMANTVGEDFIRENGGLTLDLSNDAHIQTTDNFKEGKIASHNNKIDYQERYDDWQANFQKDQNGKVATHKTRSGKEDATLVKGARKSFDDGRPSGSVEKKTDMDHTVSAGEIIRDAATNAHMTKKEQVAFANSEVNLNEIDSSLNRSKGDKSTTEWLDNPNSSGQKPNEIFDISADDDKKMRQKDAEAREEYDKQKKEGEKKSVESGKKSQKEEAFRITGQALRAVVMKLLAELIKEIMKKLIKWLQSAHKSVETLLASIKKAITSFVSNLKTHLISASATLLTTIATAIFGPIVRTISKAFTMLKQGWKSLKEAIAYIKNPENKGKSAEFLILEVGKIVVAGLSAVGALVLGETIEKGLMTIPVLAVEIPILGSLASILGLFLAGLIAGIIGAIAISIIDKAIEKKLKNDSVANEINKSNEVLNTQSTIIALNETRLVQIKNDAASIITERHAEASNIINDAIANIFRDDDTSTPDKNKVVQTGNEDDFNDLLKAN